MKKDVINLCPACFKTGQKTYMENADDGSMNAICSVHGVISYKYWHDLFVEPYYEKTINFKCITVLCEVFGYKFSSQFRKNV